jgi:hypothetical protein
MWLKLAKIGNNWPIFKLFSAIFTFYRDSFRIITFKNETFKKNPEISFLVNFANFSHNLWSKNPVMKKVGRGSSHMHDRHCIAWKDIYQRIFISYILSKNREKGYSPITFLIGICWGIWYPNFRDSLNASLRSAFSRKKSKKNPQKIFKYNFHKNFPKKSKKKFQKNISKKIFPKKKSKNPKTFMPKLLRM